MSFVVRRDHLKLVASSYLRTSLRSGAGVIFLVLSMIVGLVLAGIAVLPIETMQVAAKSGQSAEMAFNEVVAKFGPEVISLFTNVSDETARYWLTDQPALMTLFLIMMLVFLPFLASLAGFNQTSGDIGSKGLRYLLPRTERANIFLGRLIATYVFTLSVITVIFAVVALYTVVKVPYYSTGATLWWVLRGWFACAVFLLPWVALAAWISSTMEFPFLSLLILELGLILWIVIVYVMTKKLEELHYAAYATPWGYKYWLLDQNPAKVLGGVAVMLGFTGAFTWLGLRNFDKRDL
jgi:ABC-type transport system involved in multi-copper enzyme maturation permease subunit